MPRQILIAALLLGACKKEPEDPFSETSFSWEVADMYGVPNLDDDNKNDSRDWLEDARHEDDDDLVVWELPGELAEAINGGHTLTVTLSGNTEKIRLWSRTQIVLNEETLSLTMSGAVLPDLALEFGDFVASGTLALVQTDTFGAEVLSQEVRLQGAPLILNHHMLPVEKAYGVTDYPYNEDMMTAIGDVMGASFKTDNARDYQYDVWVQDEFRRQALYPRARSSQSAPPAHFLSSARVRDADGRRGGRVLEPEHPTARTSARKLAAVREKMGLLSESARILRLLARPAPSLWLLWAPAASAVRIPTLGAPEPRARHHPSSRAVHISAARRLACARFEA